MKVSDRRVVVTGMGIVSPVGNDLDTAWNAILAGRSGIAPIDTYDVSAYTTRFAGLVRDFDGAAWMGPKDVRKTDPFIHYGFAAAQQAWRQSGYELTEANRDRVAVTIGSGIGGIGSIEAQVDVLRGKGPRRVSPFFVPSSIINMVSGYVSIDLGITGPNLAVVTACTTATHSIGLAARLIACGDADAALAGGAECGSSPVGLAGFCASRALSTRNDSPETASRPWDRDRDGFVLGDGAGVLMLEERDSAVARGAPILAELIGFGMSGDAHHITLPADGGDGARRAMDNAIADAGIGVEEIGYVNAHATATHAGDIAETAAIRSSFGAHADALSVSSTKSMTGHLLGAAGGIEAIFTVLALRDQVVPPSINLDNPGEGCDLDFTPHSAREKTFDCALSNSFGFGGTNGSLIFRRA